jgi:hypothetical protein
LENEVRLLQARLGDCVPSEPSVVQKALDAARTENAALKELLRASGIDDDMQKRFIDSSSQREQIQKLLQGRGEKTPPAPQSTAASCGQVCKNDAKDDAVDEVASESLVPTTRQDPQPDTLITGDVQLTGGAENAIPQNFSWLSSPITLPDFPNDLLGDFNWLTDLDLPQQTSTNTFPASPRSQAVGRALSPGTTTPVNQIPLALMTNLVQGAQANHRFERCFIETVIRMQPAESSTACSVALSMVFQHNRKSLSLAELHDQMRPGFISACGGSSECRMKNSLLFKVLADISSV